MTTRQERRERLEQRRRRGLVRPGPVPSRTVNLASVSSRPEKVRAILAETLRDDVDMVFAVECGDLTIAEHVDLTRWCVLQLGRHLSDEGERISQSGSAIIYRRGSAVLDRVKLRVASEAGEGIRARRTLSARATFHPRTSAAWRTRVTVGHAPPGRAPRGRAAFMDALDRLRGVKAGDFNLPSSAVRRLLGLRTRSAGVMHLTAPWWIPLSAERRADVGSDHRTVDTTLWPARKPKRRRVTR